MLILLALTVQWLAPPGFMIAPTERGAALVICTGHGPLLNTGDLGRHDKAPNSKADAPCAFAGHTAAPAPALAYFAAPEAFAAPPRTAKALFDQTPGRGLVAPPPPSQGPPIRL